MFDFWQMTVVVAVLLGLVLFGAHIAVALGIAATLGILMMMNGDWSVVYSFVSNTAYTAIRGYVFAVIPLFMLMGEFLARSGAASDLFRLVNRLTRWLPGHLGVATVLSNAVFAFVTGVSIAAAAAFSRIAYPQMKRYGYERKLALSCVASSACLGMLIPPSVLMIVWAVLTEISIGSLFLAGVVPGLMLVVGFCGYIIFTAIRNPGRVGLEGRGSTAEQLALAARSREEDTQGLAGAAIGTLIVVGLVLGILGGIWAGFFTPTEGAGVGAAAALLIAIAKRVPPRELMDAVIAVGRTSAPLLLLLVMAQLYARILTMTGITSAIQSFFISSGLEPWMILAIMMAIWLVLGCIIDSVSIILLTVPVFAPIAMAIGIDPLAFAIIGILTIEAGLLTPPFGILVYTVKAAIPNERISVGEIFRGSIPFWLVMLGLVVLLANYPQIATWLPNLGRN